MESVRRTLAREYMKLLDAGRAIINGAKMPINESIASANPSLVM